MKLHKSVLCRISCNIFFADDVVYLGSEAERQEYVMAEDGLIWRGSHNRLRPSVWKYAQFERDVLDCALHLMNHVGKVRVSGRNDPVVITRCLSAAVSLNKWIESSLKILRFFSLFRLSRPSSYILICSSSCFSEILIFLFDRTCI